MKYPVCPECGRTMECTLRADRKGEYNWFACSNHPRKLQFEMMPHDDKSMLYLRIPENEDEGPYEVEY